MSCEVLVDTALGKIRGIVVDGVSRFKSIPYGAPVSGEYRFKPPRPVGSWDGVHDADTLPTSSVQYPASIFDTALGEYFAGGPVGEGDYKQAIGENCLELSLIAQAGGAASKPVMVYLHGGGFFAGSNALAAGSGQFVQENDVVLIGVNHRLGLLGFLAPSSMNENEVTSNNGLRDIVLALEWIKQHVSAFGGDPDNVTLFGESGGGAKVAAVLGMQSAAGLFHRAIIQSSPRLHFRTGEEAAAATDTFFESLVVPDGLSAMSVLQQMPADQLFELSAQTPNAFGPYVDGETIATHPFTSDWEPAVTVPLIVGSCLDEFTWFAADTLSDENAADVMRTELGDEADKILREYRPQFSSDRAAVLRALSDSLFGSFVHRTRAEWIVRAPVYSYVFAWATPVDNGRYGAFHTAELPLALRHVRYPQSEDLSLLLSSLWTSFAMTGRPSGTGVDWPQATMNDDSVLVFDQDGAKWGADPTRPLFWASARDIDFEAASAIAAGVPQSPPPSELHSKQPRTEQ